MFEAKIINNKKVISYLGNKIFDPIEDIDKGYTEKSYFDNRKKNFYSNYNKHLLRIDNAIYKATVAFFIDLNSFWVNLPLTTLMISSPGEVYNGKQIDYTTDTLPIIIRDWFRTGKDIYLSESSQLYLELFLQNIDEKSVFSIYNSFRKEKSDFCHLTEFQHVEYEGKVNLTEVKSIIVDLIRYIIDYLFQNNLSDLRYFLFDYQIESLKQNTYLSSFTTIDLSDGLKILHEKTKESTYLDFSMKHFGSWEEIFLTNYLGKNLFVEKFPLLQIPFYHDILNEKHNGIPLANNSDLLMLGYREVVGAGERIKDKELLNYKAEAFSLPKEDYEPYLLSRDKKDYQSTSGFGLGWQRLVQWILQLPTISDATVIPRSHHIPNP